MRPAHSLALLAFALSSCASTDRKPPAFELVQPQLFGEPRSLTNAWADYDNDGDYDLFVGFNRTGNRLYRNDGGVFADVAAEVGLGDREATRASAWGDFDGDGHLDLYVGFQSEEVSDRLYRNAGDGSRFIDVSDVQGVNVPKASTRQVSWIDFDRDGDLDLSVCLRNLPNVLLRNDGGSFIDVAQSMGIADPRHTVGALWFDFDQDGDLDQFVANMDGDANGLFRNDGAVFVDVAVEHGLDGGGRPIGDPEYGSPRASLVDYDNDGFLDLFFSNYGPNGLFRNQGDGKFVNVAESMGLAVDARFDTGSWGDFDNDGRIDLYVNGTVSQGTSYRDYLYRNEGEGFAEVTPAIVMQEADHGVQWVDFDRDGDLDLSLTGASAEGMTHLLRNQLAGEASGRCLQVLVLDENGHFTRPGAEVRVYASGTENVLGTGIVDTGSGYNSQNALPLYFGLPDRKPVDVVVTVLGREGRQTVRLGEIDPSWYAGRILRVKVDANGWLVQ
ncbi:MAG: CRTAC1 family protein [Planctomycetota bacterium]|jgi:hypothetical protein